jgi:hypothetical protein
MDSPIIFVVIILVVIAIIFFGYYYSKKAKIKRKLKNAELKSIAKFKSGDIARIVGKVEFIGNPLLAPLSNRECSYYYIHVERKVKSGKSSTWRTIIEEEVSSKFLIKEGDNYAYINDNNLKCYIVQDKSYSSGFLNDASVNLENYLNRKGYESEGMLGFNKTLRYKEGILEGAEEIAVFGKGVWKNASELSLPEKYGKVLEITSTNDVAVYLSDDPDTTIKKAKKDNYKSKKDYNYNNNYKK